MDGNYSPRHAHRRQPRQWGCGEAHAGQTHLAASLAAIRRGCWNPKEPFVYIE